MNWFTLHLSDEKATLLNRKEYYAARSWLRRTQHIIRLRYAAAHVDDNSDSMVIIIPSTESVLPEKFK